MNDWVGNSNSIYKTLGASNHTDKEREENDYYATDSIAIDALLEKATLSHNLWECACGGGHLSRRLMELGYNVKSTDLIYRGFGEGGWTSSVFMRLSRGISLLIRPTKLHYPSLNMRSVLSLKGTRSLCS